MDVTDPLPPRWLGSRAYDAGGARVGHVADVLFDVVTHRPAWLLLVLLRAEDRLVFAPARGVVHRAGGVELGVARDLVRTAPLRATPPGELEAEHAAALSRHYGLRPGGGPWRGIVDPRLRRADDRVRMG